ncbi:MAG: Lipid-A-disaccharide synthase [Chlamydiae bacterium]|nr:Lipid-A-disaccharide synthase [Chlamydiota bacterium]
MITPSIFLFAGETSGDIHGEALIEALKKKIPMAQIYGVGGPRMRKAGMHTLMEMEKFQVMGFVDVFFALPRLMWQFFSLRRQLLKRKPDIVLLIDYPGFNLALAKSLYKKSFPGKVCQYICPSVWAWGKKRIPKMEKILDHLFVTFPFEKELFNSKNLQVDYVGHPLVRKILASSSRPLDINKKYRVVGIFPGSRKKELLRNFPLQLQVAKRLLAEFPDLFFTVSVSQPSFSPLLEKLMREVGFPDREKILLIESSQNGALMQRCDLSIAKSGTNNLELALYGVPTVVTYGIGPLDLFIAKTLLRIRLPFYSIVNIIAKEKVFPELIGPHFTEDQLFTEARRLLSSEEARNECGKKCQKIGIILEQKSPEVEIATKLKELLLNEQGTI